MARCVPWIRPGRANPSQSIDPRKKKGAAPDDRADPLNRRSLVSVELHDVLSRRALLSLHQVELDSLALGEGPEALGLDCGVVDEAVPLPFVRGDEPKALGVVEPLYGAGGTHVPYSLLVIALVGVRNDPYLPTARSADLASA
jgi:hypothetical protein